MTWFFDGQISSFLPKEDGDLKQYRRARRVGLCAILCALVLRLWAAGLPEKFLSWLSQPDTLSFLTYIKTGHYVRFSPSLEAFSPNFMESPPPFVPEPTMPPIPGFSGEEEVDVYYAAKKDPDIPALLQKPLEWDLYGTDPTVLILHTHSTESYTRTTEDYREVSAWRTLEEDYNMLSIGRQVAELLTREGIAVLQDRELHDYPSYNGSYVHARSAIASYLKQYPSIRLVLDLHRDASGGEGGQMRTKAQVEGQPCAQLMMVVGTNHETYEENLSFALKLHVQLETQAPGITRPLQLRQQRFNQDLCPAALIVEVGAAGNTHPEAMTAAKELAKAIIALAKGSR